MVLVFHTCGVRSLTAAHGKQASVPRGNPTAVVKRRCYFSTMDKSRLCGYGPEKGKPGQARMGDKSWLLASQMWFSSFFLVFFRDPMKPGTTQNKDAFLHRWHPTTLPPHGACLALASQPHKATVSPHPLLLFHAPLLN
ncbi:uncharacterized [Tachysurus ichikawai]